MMEDSPQTAPQTLIAYAIFRVSVSAGPDVGATRELSYLPLRVGTSSANDLILNDPRVSQRHCVLEPVAEGLRIRDEGSERGLFLGTVRVFDAVAAPPFQLALGETLLSVEQLPRTLTRARAGLERFGDLLGRSERMRELFAELSEIALSADSVLIEGERGTGRELIAESIHDESFRSGRPFVVLDCGDPLKVPSEDDLIGHERGAFAGARDGSAGVFERASSGAVYLHEIGALPLRLQAEIVRVLESGSVRRRGAREGLTLDVRLLSSSSKDLETEVQRGTFRRDLLTKIAVRRVRVPPLRDRMDDLALLAEHFLHRANARPHDFPAVLWEMFASYRWPGNVHELASVLDSLLGTGLGPRENSTTLAPEARNEFEATNATAPIEPLHRARQTARERFEQDYLRQILARTEGNVTRAAAIAEVSRQMLQKLMRKYRNQ
jgi:DNA-binding NtrC family response regulator